MAGAFFIEGTKVGKSEPPLAARDISLDEFRIAFCEVNNPLDESYDAEETAGYQAENQLDNSFLGVAQIEFMDRQATK